MSFCFSSAAPIRLQHITQIPRKVEIPCDIISLPWMHLAEAAHEAAFLLMFCNHYLHWRRATFQSVAQG